MSQTELFLAVMLMIFAVPYGVWRVTWFEHVVPLAIVQIVGGVLLGPGILGHMTPEIYAALFTYCDANIDRRRHVGGHAVCFSCRH